jgi:hypothetical protein
MAKRKRVNSDIRTAKQRATVRFSPERATIKALIGDAKSRFSSDLTAADAGAKSAIHFADKARKPTAAIFNTARSQADAARSDVESAFGKLGAAADPFRAATSREQTGTRQRVALARAEALNDLTSRKLEAKAGGQYAGNQARQTFRKDVGDLGTRLRDLGDRQGAFVAQEAAALADARAKQGVPVRVAKINASARTKAARATARAQARRDATTFGHQKELEGIKQAGREKLASTRATAKANAKKKNPASRSELRMFKTDYAKASVFARRFAASGGKVPRHVAATTLIKGRPSKTGVGGVPAIGNQLALSVALDMAYDGHVSRANARAMRKGAGLRLRDVGGLTSYSQWLKNNQRYMTSPT